MLMLFVKILLFEAFTRAAVMSIQGSSLILINDTYFTQTTLQLSTDTWNDLDPVPVLLRVSDNVTLELKLSTSLSASFDAFHVSTFYPLFLRRRPGCNVANFSLEQSSPLVCCFTGTGATAASISLVANSSDGWKIFRTASLPRIAVSGNVLLSSPGAVAISVDVSGSVPTTFRFDPLQVQGQVSMSLPAMQQFSDLTDFAVAMDSPSWIVLQPSQLGFTPKQWITTVVSSGGPSVLCNNQTSFVPAWATDLQSLPTVWETIGMAGVFEITEAISNNMSTIVLTSLTSASKLPIGFTFQFLTPV